MDILEYSCTFLEKKYILYHASFHTYLQVKSITVFDSVDNRKLQCFTYPQCKKTIIPYMSSSPSFDLMQVLYAFLQSNEIPFPDVTVQTIPSLLFVSKPHKNVDMGIDANTIVFSTHTYSFRAVIKEEPYNYSVKVGGKDFVGYVELFLDKPDHPYYSQSKLAQVYSEPECWYQLGKKGSIVDLLKGSFQLCQLLFGINIFCFDDNSNIECATTTKDGRKPRKLEKPLSLAHLSIAEKGKTWYETHFNAFLKNPSLRPQYQQSIQRLQSSEVKHDISFDSFAAVNRLQKDQIEQLKPLFESSTSDTWMNFFRSIPKQKQCTLLFNWLPSYLNTHILKFDPTRHEWCIYLGMLGISEKEEKGPMPIMSRTDLFVEMVPTTIRQWRRRQNRNRNRYTRKSETIPISFSNTY